MKELILKSAKIENNCLVLGVENIALARLLVEELNFKKKYCAEIKEYRKKRSLNANSMLWEMCEQLAKKLNDDQETLSTDEKHLFTKTQIYKNAIKEVGIFQDIEINTKGASTMAKIWEEKGIGWFVEIIDQTENTDRLRLYYGSSCYNTKQMSVLIDYVIQDCKAVGIDVLSEVERQRLLDDWGKK